MVKRGPATDFELRVDGVCKFSYGLSREALPLAKAAGCHLAIWGGTGAPATAGEALEHLGERCQTSRPGRITSRLWTLSSGLNPMTRSRG